MTALRRWVDDHPADPLVVSCWVAGALIVTGFATVLLGWRGAAATLAVPIQLPYLVSGGLGGLALVIAAAAVLDVQVARRTAARERIELDAVLVEARALVDAVTSDRSPSPSTPRAGTTALR